MLANGCTKLLGRDEELKRLLDLKSAPLFSFEGSTSAAQVPEGGIIVPPAGESLEVTSCAAPVPGWKTRYGSN